MNKTVTESKKFIAILSQTLSSTYLVMTKFSVSCINYFSHEFIAYFLFFNGYDFHIFLIDEGIGCYYTFWNWYVSYVHFGFALITQNMLTKNNVLFSFYSVFTIGAYILVIKLKKLKYIRVILANDIEDQKYELKTILLGIALIICMLFSQKFDNCIQNL